MYPDDFLGMLKSRQQANIALAKRLLEVDASKLNASPKGKEWSALQCVEHLVLTDKIYLDYFNNLRHSIGSAVPNKPYKPTAMVKLIIWMVGPRGKVMVPVPEKFEPTKGMKDKSVIERYLELQSLFDVWLRDAKELDLRSKVTSPVNEKMSFPLGAALHMLMEHDARHLMQAQRAIS